MIENRRVGIKSRELYEVPGALAIILAHRALEDLTLEREVAHHKPLVEQRWADLVYDGQWFSPLRAAIDAYVDATQTHVTGDVRLRFEPGTCTVVGAALGALALRPVARHVRQRRRVRPVARRGLRAPLRAPAQGVVGEAGRRVTEGDAAPVRRPRLRRAALGRPVHGGAGAGGARARRERAVRRAARGPRRRRRRSRTCGALEDAGLADGRRRGRADGGADGRRAPDRGRGVRVRPRRRGRALGDRARRDGPAGRRGRQAARRPQPQRPRGHRPAPVAPGRGPAHRRPDDDARRGRSSLARASTPRP